MRRPDGQQLVALLTVGLAKGKAWACRSTSCSAGRPATGSASMPTPARRQRSRQRLAPRLHRVQDRARQAPAAPATSRRRPQVALRRRAVRRAAQGRPATTSTSASTSTAPISPATAKLLIKALEPYQPMFIEEPVNCQNHDVMAEIARGTHLPIATGERVFTKWGFREVLEKKAATILQPDLCHAGGITEVPADRRHGRGVLRGDRAAQPARADLAGRRHPARGVDPELPLPGAGQPRRGLPQEAVHGARRLPRPADRARAWASSWTRTRWPTRSATTGRTRRPTTRTTARWSIGEAAVRVAMLARRLQPSGVARCHSPSPDGRWWPGVASRRIGPGTVGPLSPFAEPPSSPGAEFGRRSVVVHGGHRLCQTDFLRLFGYNRAHDELYEWMRDGRAEGPPWLCGKAMLTTACLAAARKAR